MRHESLKRFALFFLCAVVVLGLSALPASAQATRTWVSGVGDDANPCSRTAPCKTFAGAISKTAAAGEINCLDPGGFGAVTITKSVTISCEGVTAGVLVSGTNGVLINAAATDSINLTGLDFNGPGLSAVKVLGAALVHIHNCNIRGFATGIDVQPNAGNTGPTYVIATDTILDKNSTGVLFKASNATAAATGFLDRVTIMGTSINNGGFGVTVDGANASLVLNNTTIVRNQTGLNRPNGGLLFSFVNNRVVQNQTNGTPSSNLTPQ